VPHDPRIREIRLNATIDVHVGAAHADTPHAYQYFVVGRLGDRPSLDDQAAGFRANDYFHQGVIHCSSAWLR
jgi:hypothetical protein